MNEKIRIIICGIVFVVIAYACLAFGLWVGRSFGRTERTDSQRVERYEDRSESAQNAVTELESGLNDVAEQMHGVGKEIESGITDVGELREVGVRIAGASSDIEDSACRIEEGIQRIERILYEAEKNSFLLEDNSDCAGSDGGS